MGQDATVLIEFGSLSEELTGDSPLRGRFPLGDADLAENGQFVADIAEADVLRRVRHGPPRKVIAVRAPLLFGHLQFMCPAGI